MDFDSCKSNEKDAQHIHERFKALLELMKREYPKYGDARFESYAGPDVQEDRERHEGQVERPFVDIFYGTRHIAW